MSLLKLSYFVNVNDFLSVFCEKKRDIASGKKYLHKDLIHFEIVFRKTLSYFGKQLKRIISVFISNLLSI